MRILIESPSYWPNVSGVAVFVELLATHLRDHGHEVFIVAPAFGLHTSREIDPRNNIPIYRMRAIPNVTRRGFFVPFMVRGLTRRLVEELRPDVVHTHDPLATSRYLAEAARLYKIPVIATNHFMLDSILAYAPIPLKPVVREYMHAMMVGFYNTTTVVTCPTRTVVTHLKEMGVHRPIYPLSNGVNINRFFTAIPTEQVRHRYHLPHTPLVLYVGRLDKEKSVDILLEAAEIVTQNRNCHFIMVGSGTKMKQYQRLIKQKKLEHHVTFTGKIEHKSDALVGLYQLADIFVMPSSLESQSISTMEAMAAGKAIIAANGGALKELITSGENGLLFPPGDSQALAAAIIRLIDSPAERLSYGSESLNRITNHELTECLSLYEKLYRECASVAAI